MNESERKLYGDNKSDWPTGDIPGFTDMGVISRYSEHDVAKRHGKRNFVKNNIDLVRYARETKRDLVAFSKGREVKILIGAGIATAGIIGGVVLYRHRQKNIK